MISFGEVYAKYYDALYQDKDYEGECDVLEEIFEKYSVQDVKTILDVGCGTGGHMVPLIKRGYDVTGVEPSDYMRHIAEEKVGNRKIWPGRMENFLIPPQVDVVISMFNVVGYILDKDQLLASFRNVRRHIKDGGLFVFDFWYTPAVIDIEPEARQGIIKVGDLSISRTVYPVWYKSRHIIKSCYEMRIFYEGREIERAEEDHEVKYFFPDTLVNYLETAKFEVLNLCKFMDLDTPPSKNTWSAMIIARAVR